MMVPYNFETNVFGNFNHDTNYGEWCVENYFIRKITQPCQNNLEKFS